MGGYYGLAILVGMASLLMTGQCDVNCRATDGRAGEVGLPGRDGLPGAKGEKGEPAVMPTGPVDPAVLLRLKGETGSRGKQGDMGPKGYRGDLGLAGFPGQPGRRGADGKSIGQRDESRQQARSAFSAIRTDHSYPRFDQIVTYRQSVVNTGGDFDISTGRFTCRIPGVYYFTFHSVAKVSMCLSIASNSPSFRDLGFCDYNRNTDQVLSGGAVLQLTKDQTVYLKSFRENQRDSETRDTQEKQIIFSGFLLFPDQE